MNHCIDFDKIETINVDFVLGFGSACCAADALRRNHLRYFSSPFDWMMNYNLDTAMNILEDIAKNKKPKFFDNCRENENYARGKYTVIVDSDNGMTSMHDFPSNMDIKKAPYFFYKKYERRFLNLNNILKNATAICILTYRQISLDDMKTFVNFLKQVYSIKQIYFINIFDSPEESFEQYCDKGVKYLIYKFNDEHKNGRDKSTNPNFWRGNIDYWDKILSKIKLNNKFRYLYKLKRFIFCISTDCSYQKMFTVVNILGIRFKFKIKL